MLNSEQITIGRLKQAYELSGYDIDALMFKLLPSNVFPYALWQNAYTDFWHWSIRASAQRYGLKEPEFPDAGALPEIQGGFSFLEVLFPLSQLPFWI